MPLPTEACFDVDTVASYLYHLNPEISPLKLQKGLYFLYAYYGATYGHEVGEGVSERINTEPKLLFEAEFEAWKFGPVIKSVYSRDHYDNYYNDEKRIESSVEAISLQPEAKQFIDDLFSQINSVSDFQLVERSHQDYAWKEAYQRGQSSIMDNEAIINEYQTRYVANVD